ncbi:WD domain G-beta repeat family protein [Cryptosporidium meleagridis]|uniref:WD domain G-beta repeat family protein n=1 Tax=Cryptosporidium meleagridis TaxID=93969 RepID=A0A2P4YWM9_9CRYT|nr:WD domain G-beta repeat family protein [Cryptosporidium meleagridis]
MRNMDLSSRNNSLFYYNDQLIWFQKNKLFSFSLADYQQTEIALGNEEDTLVSVNISTDGTATACSSNKLIYIVKICNFSFQLIGQFMHSKRLNISIFKPDTKEVIIGDKFGDLYLIDASSVHISIKNDRNLPSFDNDSDSEELLNSNMVDCKIPKMGHLSTVTCSIVSYNSKILFTGNKCGKIWVSNIKHLENTLSILCGHSDAISSLYEVKIAEESSHLIISSSLDKRIKLWDYLYGTEIDSMNLESIPLEVKFSSSLKKIFIKCEDLSVITVVQLDSCEKNMFRFRNELTTINLNSIPYSIEITEPAVQTSPKILEDLIDIKDVECVLWYKNYDDLPCPITINTKNSHLGHEDESRCMNYTIFPDALKHPKKPKKNIFTISTQNSDLKRVKISD